MPHYLQTFFERFGGEFLFLSYEEVTEEFWSRSLPPMLSNCISAMASRFVAKCRIRRFLLPDVIHRFSNLPELTVRGLHNVAETYTDNAKVSSAMSTDVTRILILF